MIKLSYKMAVETIEDTALSSMLNETGTFQSISNYSTLDGIRLVAKDSSLISNAFKRHKTKKSDIYKRDGYVVKQEETKYNLHHKVDYFDILDLSETSYKEFLQKYSKHIIGKVGDRVPSGISMYDQVRVVEIKDNTVTKIDESMYGLEISHGKVYVDSTLVSDDLYVLLFRDAGKVIKVDDNFDISNERLLSLDSGFYQILPKYYHSTKELYTSKSNGKLSVQVDKLTRLVSDVYVNIDGCITNSFILQPGLEIPVRYSQDFTPLPEVKEFWDNKEYIIFKLEGTSLAPLYHITSEGSAPTEEYKTLMKSHQEFLRSYVVVSNKAFMLRITDKVEEDEILNLIRISEDTFTIDNTYFKTILNANPDLIKIKI